MYYLLQFHVVCCWLVVMKVLWWLCELWICSGAQFLICFISSTPTASTIIAHTNKIRSQYKMEIQNKRKIILFGGYAVSICYLQDKWVFWLSEYWWSVKLEMEIRVGNKVTFKHFISDKAVKSYCCYVTIGINWNLRNILARMFSCALNLVKLFELVF